MTTRAKPKLKLADYKRKLVELEAQLASTYYFASVGISKADRSRTMGSGVLVTLAYLGGKEVCPPFLARDGLSDASIAALTEDMRYSYKLSTEVKPLGFVT